MIITSKQRLIGNPDSIRSHYRGLQVIGKILGGNSQPGSVHFARLKPDEYEALESLYKQLGRSFEAAGDGA